MDNVLKLLNDTQYGFLATVDNGKPRVRPFGFMFEEGGKLYFCTNNTKDVYKQLNESPNIEYSATSKEMVTVRITGKVAFTEELDKKQKALDSSDLVKGLYKSADNPIFKVFYVEHGTAIISDFSGQPPRVLNF